VIFVSFYFFLCCLGTEIRNGKNLVTIEERARRVYQPSKSAFFGNSTAASPGHKSKHTTDDGDQASSSFPASKAEKKTLESLEIFDRFNISEPLEEGEEEDPYTNESKLKTPAWRTADDLLREEKPKVLLVESKDEADNDAFGRVRLDKIDIDDQELFDNFGPIFELGASVQPVGMRSKEAEEVKDEDI
jgi:hypothetical protein